VTDFITKQRAATLVAASSTISAVVGFGLSLAFVPIPEPKQNCTIFKVNKQAETAFVLKPPALVCPQIEKCEVSTNNPEPTTIDNQTSTKETVDEAPKPRHKRWRRHRIRRRWK
jgi:hypothetical protein